MIGGLTKRQREALTYIERYCADTGLSPSYEEIMGAIGLHSKSGVHRIILALEERELIRRHKERARSISVVQKYCKNCGHLLP